MIREARGYGSDITEAQENARKELGASIDDDVQFEIITQSKKKVLGIFGGAKAEVRAYIEMPDEKPAKAKKAPKKKPAKVENKIAADKNAAKRETPAKKETKPATEIDYSNAIDEEKIDKDSKTGKAIAYLKEILLGLGCENITFKAIENEDSSVIILDGEGLGILIGRRGDTLDALQYLARLAANNGGGYYKITLNVGNYREKREQTLISLAKKASAQVLKTGKNKTLEPMNPYERRIIHSAVQEMEGVSSSSVGNGDSRRVVIYPEGSEPRAYDNRRRNGRNQRGGNRGNERKSSQSVSAAPQREPKKDSDIPLYGKIN